MPRYTALMKRIDLAMMLMMTILFCSACATSVKFDPSKPLADGPVYRQEGKVVDTQDLLTKLKQNPAAHDAALSAEIYGWTSSGLGGVSGGHMGLAFTLPKAESGQGGLSDSTQTAFLVGAGVATVGSIVTYLVFKKHIARAASIHNGSLKPTGVESSQVVLEPYVGYADATAVGGLSLSW